MPQWRSGLTLPSCLGCTSACCSIQTAIRIQHLPSIMVTTGCLQASFLIFVTPVTHDFWSVKDESIRNLEVLGFLKVHPQCA